MEREELIQIVKNCGQSLIDNAEKIAQDYKYMTDLTITCHVSEIDNVPYINVSTDFLPENFIGRL